MEKGEKQALIELLQSDIDWDETFLKNSQIFASRFSVTDPLFLQKITSLTHIYNFISYAEFAVINQINNNDTNVSETSKLIMTAGYQAGTDWTRKFLNDLNETSTEKLSLQFLDYLTERLVNLQEKAVIILQGIDSND